MTLAKQKQLWNSQHLGLKAISLLLIVTVISFGVGPVSWAQPSSEGEAQGTASGAGIQAASAFCTILYFPFKAAFAITGGVFGGLAFLVNTGNENVAKTIWTTTMFGTHVITPENLKGKRPVRFLGGGSRNQSRS